VSAEPQTIREFSNDLFNDDVIVRMQLSEVASHCQRTVTTASLELVWFVRLSDFATNTISFCIVRRRWIYVFLALVRVTVFECPSSAGRRRIVRHMVVG
jgi:hypothetical protein